LVVGWPGRAPRARSGFCRRGFTLIELLLVLALLAMAVAVAAPSLSRFFRGRALDSEGRRMLALTRYAQNRAVSEGVPIVMWFNPENQTYGIEAEVTYDQNDPEAIAYELDSNLEMELPKGVITETIPWKATTEIAGDYPSIRFTPDGFIDENSPEWVWIKVTRADTPDAVWLALSDNRLNYELQNSQPLERR
jgi:type II secretion system protein H